MTLYEDKDSYEHGETREMTSIYLKDILLDIGMQYSLVTSREAFEAVEVWISHFLSKKVVICENVF